MVAKDFLVDLWQKAHDGGDVECIERRAFVPAGENPPFAPLYRSTAGFDRTAGTVVVSAQ
jgi:hypothetical protein